MNKLLLSTAVATAMLLTACGSDKKASHPTPMPKAPTTTTGSQNQANSAGIGGVGSQENPPNTSGITGVDTGSSNHVGSGGSGSGGSSSSGSSNTNSGSTGTSSGLHSGSGSTGGTAGSSSSGSSGTNAGGSGSSGGTAGGATTPPTSGSTGGTTMPPTSGSTGGSSGTGSNVGSNAGGSNANSGSNAGSNAGGSSSSGSSNTNSGSTGGTAGSSGSSGSNAGSTTTPPTGGSTGGTTTPPTSGSTGGTASGSGSSGSNAGSTTTPPNSGSSTGSTGGINAGGSSSSGGSNANSGSTGSTTPPVSTGSGMTSNMVADYNIMHLDYWAQEVRREFQSQGVSSHKMHIAGTEYDANLDKVNLKSFGQGFHILPFKEVIQTARENKKATHERTGALYLFQQQYSAVGQIFTTETKTTTDGSSTSKAQVKKGDDFMVGEYVDISRLPTSGRYHYVGESHISERIVTGDVSTVPEWKKGDFQFTIDFERKKGSGRIDEQDGRTILLKEGDIHRANIWSGEYSSIVLGDIEIEGITNKKNGYGYGVGILGSKAQEVVGMIDVSYENTHGQTVYIDGFFGGKHQ